MQSVTTYRFPCHFNPRARVGRDICFRSFLPQSAHFNPRARVGRDREYCSQCSQAPHFNPRARVGRDALLHQSSCARRYFNPRARVGRDEIVVALIVQSLISIHAPAWGATCMPRAPRTAKTFQSTRPRGARLLVLTILAFSISNFNPRARVGRDSACLHGLNYSGCAIFFANLIFSRAVTGIFRRKVLCVIRVRTEILRLFSRRSCLLQHQSSFSFITWFCTDVLRFSCVFIAQIIKTQTVFFLVNQRCQFMPQGAEACFIKNAFKHGILHALSVTHAALRHLPQACTSSGCFCIDIVCHEDQHFPPPPYPSVSRSASSFIPFFISTEMPDIPPRHRVNIAPEGAIGHTAPSPRGFSP